MTIFDFISNILFTKKEKSIDNVDNESAFSPFLVNRWLSMHSPNVAIISNLINKYIGLYDDKNMIYALFYALFPRCPFKKINYFKKTKDTLETNKDLDIIKKVAFAKELSIREIKEYVDLNDSLTKS